MKLALVSHVLPGSGLGQATVIHRMFSGFKPENYCLISLPPQYPVAHGEAQPDSLPVKHYQLSRAFRLTRGHRFVPFRIRESINILWAIIRHARSIAAIIRKEGCDAVMACTGDVTLLPASYFASRWTRVPFYAYIFDHYSYREWQNPVAAFWARRFESRLMKGAAAVIAPNEILRDELRRQYGIEAAVIHNSFDISPYEIEPGPRSDEDEGEIKIVYTGEIYEAHYDAFRNLLEAIESLSRPEVKLHLYSNHPLKYLNAKGIKGPIVHHQTRAGTEMPNVQMQADLLFLPLAFASPYPDLVRTSSTTKLGEYLAARRPVLVHAPAGSFVSWYFRQYNCGLVVDDSDPAKLADGIERILKDSGLREKMIANAWQRASVDFDIRTSRAAFAHLLGLELCRAF
jgi:glycosyltransferase involved in cell wall biosynthesis